MQKHQITSQSQSLALDEANFTVLSIKYDNYYFIQRFRGTFVISLEIGRDSDTPTQMHAYAHMDTHKYKNTANNVKEVNTKTAN